MKAVTSDFVRKVYPVREKWSHKGDFGRLLIIGGSRRYRGAPALCGLAALRAGVDLVTIASPESAADVIASFSPNLITEPLEGDFINPENIKKLAAISKNSDAVLIGNGMGRMAKSMETVFELLRVIEKPCILDADALYMLAENRRLLKRGWVITPHEHEFYNLSGVKPSRKLEDRVKHAEKFSDEFKVTVLLKGHKDVISEGRTSYINSTGNPFMTVGGTGDVLAGICGALLASGLKSLDAAAAAAYLCGSAGDLAARQMGPGLLATDVIEKIPEAIRNVVEFEDLIR
jgi:NAD(P)H-hydrate epimerase